MYDVNRLELADDLLQQLHDSGYTIILLIEDNLQRDTFNIRFKMQMGALNDNLRVCLTRGKALNRIYSYISDTKKKIHNQAEFIKNVETRNDKMNINDVNMESLSEMSKILLEMKFLRDFGRNNLHM